jgi:hypothetical protein
MGVLKMGTIGLDGTKLHANASRHNALSYEHAGKIEAQLKAEFAQLLEAMAHKLKTPEGRALYALRKQTPDPVFGIINSVLGFRQFFLRGIEKVRGEWSLVTMAWNLKRMFVLNPA